MASLRSNIRSDRASYFTSGILLPTNKTCTLNRRIVTPPGLYFSVINLAFGFRLRNRTINGIYDVASQAYKSLQAEGPG
jgi:hypothetical protein